MRETIQPENEHHWRELRSQDVTSTEVAALFDCSPYATQFELWHRLRDRAIVEMEPTERVKWGTRLQDSIAAGIAEDNKFQIRRMTEYIRDTEIGAGASFDFAIDETGLLEVKNVDALQFRDGWLVEGNEVEAPPHIELQVQQQLMLSGRSFALIGALVGGNRVVALHRRPDTAIHEAIKQKIVAFRESITLNVPPVPDFSRDAAFLSKLYGHAEAGKLYDGRNDAQLREWADEYKRLGDEGKEIDAARTALKMQILTTIGDAEKALGDGFSVTAGLVAGGPVSYERTQYRNFRINWSKGKK